MIYLAALLLLVGVTCLFCAFPYAKKTSGGLLVLAAVFCLVSCLTIVPAGHVGVLAFFGKVYGQVPEGLNFVNPLSSVTKMTVRTQEVFEHAAVPSKEGLNVELEVSLLGHLNGGQASAVYQKIGPEYLEVVVKPQFRSAIRDITTNYEAKDLYTSTRDKVQLEIQELLAKSLGVRGWIVEQVLLRRVALPKMVSDAIDAKLAADQEAQRMQFVLVKEKQEAERKRIEAQGIQDFQTIVAKGVSEPLLRWKGIEATEKLAQSSNAKVIIIGGKDGLPIILSPGQ